MARWMIWLWFYQYDVWHISISMECRLSKIVPLLTHAPPDSIQDGGHQRQWRPLQEHGVQHHLRTELHYSCLRRQCVPCSLGRSGSDLYTVIFSGSLPLLLSAPLPLCISASLHLSLPPFLPSSLPPFLPPFSLPPFLPCSLPLAPSLAPAPSLLPQLLQSGSNSTGSAAGAIAGDYVVNNVFDSLWEKYNKGVRSHQSPTNRVRLVRKEGRDVSS